MTNQHFLYDPIWAEATIRGVFSVQLELAEEMVRFGADLLLRSQQTTPSDADRRHVLYTLCRQGVAAFDGARLALFHGAIGPASVHIRSQLETHWQLKLAKEDLDRWGRHIFVSTVLQHRHWARVFIAGTAEHERFGDARSLIEQAGGTSEAEARTAEQSADAALCREDLKVIASRFEQYAAKYRRPADWWVELNENGSLPMTSIASLARRVGAVAEYDTVYRNLSYHVHGSFGGAHLDYSDGGISLRHLRTVEQWRSLFLLSSSLYVGHISAVINAFRSGEIADFLEGTGARWRSQIEGTPDPVVSTM